MHICQRRNQNRKNLLFDTFRRDTKLLVKPTKYQDLLKTHRREKSRRANSLFPLNYKRDHITGDV